MPSSDPKSTALLTGAGNDPSRLIRSIFVEESCADLPYTKDILARAKDIPVHVIADRAAPALGLGPYPQSLSKGKQHLYLCRNRGRFLKPCPGTREYKCCDYQVLNIGMNCPMDCVYCILQAYLNNPWLSFFVNTENLLRELDEAFAKTPRRFWRIGTGEFTDSMALDRLTGLSRILIEYMRDKENAVLELKSKAVVPDHLAGLDHNNRTILAWSLNSPRVMARQELHTAALGQRLEAARQGAAWGYRLAFHFDPLIFYPGWQEGYEETIDNLFAAVPADRIAWISMGAFRFLPHLKTVIASRFPGSRFIHEEFVLGLDNKFRYFRSLRVEMYRHILHELQKHAAPDTCIYLCMESDVVWREVFGFTPADHGGLAAMLDKAAETAC